MIRDTRAAQCERAAVYMKAHPGCTLRELASGADLGSAAKVVSEMTRTYGYDVRRERVRVPSADGTYSHAQTRYRLAAQPARGIKRILQTIFAWLRGGRS